MLSQTLHTIPEPHSNTIHVRGTVTALTLSERRGAKAHLTLSTKSPLKAYKSKAEVQVHRKRARAERRRRGRQQGKVTTGHLFWCWTARGRFHHRSREQTDT